MLSTHPVMMMLIGPGGFIRIKIFCNAPLACNNRRYTVAVGKKAFLYTATEDIRLCSESGRKEQKITSWTIKPGLN